MIELNIYIYEGEYILKYCEPSDVGLVADVGRAPLRATVYRVYVGGVSLESRSCVRLL